MNQQTLMAVLRAYPAPKASDELLWRELTKAWRNEASARSRKVREISDDDEPRAQSPMTRNLEKILSTTRSYWAAS
jgi:hypothetical protein